MKAQWIKEWETCNEPYVAYEIWEKQWLKEHPEDRGLSAYKLTRKYAKDGRIDKNNISKTCEQKNCLHYDWKSENGCDNYDRFNRCGAKYYKGNRVKKQTKNES